MSFQNHGDVLFPQKIDVLGGRFVGSTLESSLALSWRPHWCFQVYRYTIGFVVVEQGCGWMFQGGYIAQIPVKISLFVEKTGPGG